MTIFFSSGLGPTDTSVGKGRRASKSITRRSANAAAVIFLALAASLVSATAAHAETDPVEATRTVVWFVPGGFASRWGETQELRPSAVGCGDYQVDVYRYGTPSDIAFVDALVATGVLHGPSEDSPVFVSSTDVTSTATCAPAVPPAASAELSTVACVTAGSPVDSRTASVVLDDTGSGTDTTFTVNGVGYPVAAGATRTVSLTGIADAGATIAVTAAGRTWSFDVAPMTACGDESGVPASAPGDTGAPGATNGAGDATSGTAVGAAVPAAVVGNGGASPTASDVAAASGITPAAAGGSPLTADSSLAFTGSTDMRPGFAVGGGIVALGLGLVLWTRRRGRALEAAESTAGPLG